MALMVLRPVLVTPPAAAPVTLSEFKQHARVDFDDDDALLQSYLDAAVSFLDAHTGVLGRAMITQTWSVSASALQEPIFRLPVGDLQAIISVTYYDAAGDAQTLAGSTYRSGQDYAGPYIRRATQSSWPSSFDDRDDAVTITWTCGYGNTADDVPRAIRQAIMMMASHWYEHRETVSDVRLMEVPMAVTSLTEAFRVRRL